MPKPSTAIEVALRQVRQEVYAAVATVPGGYTMAILAAAERAGYHLVKTRSEAGAAFIAAAWAWESGRPALACVITSPGIYGTLQALHYAAVDRVPLILLSGEASLAGSAQAGDGVAGPSITRVTSPLAAWSADVHRADELPAILARAARIASVSSQPVHLNVPTHVAAAGASHP